jgi:hypothetical protein
MKNAVDPPVNPKECPDRPGKKCHMFLSYCEKKCGKCKKGK